MKWRTAQDRAGYERDLLLCGQAFSHETEGGLVHIPLDNVTPALHNTDEPTQD